MADQLWLRTCIREEEEEVEGTKPMECLFVQQEMIGWYQQDMKSFGLSREDVQCQSHCTCSDSPLVMMSYKLSCY